MSLCFLPMRISPPMDSLLWGKSGSIHPSGTEASSLKKDRQTIPELPCSSCETGSLRPWKKSFSRPKERLLGLVVDHGALLDSSQAVIPSGLFGREGLRLPRLGPDGRAADSSAPQPAALGGVVPEPGGPPLILQEHLVGGPAVMDPGSLVVHGGARGVEAEGHGGHTEVQLLIISEVSTNHGRLFHEGLSRGKTSYTSSPPDRLAFLPSEFFFQTAQPCDIKGARAVFSLAEALALGNQ